MPLTGVKQIFLEHQNERDRSIYLFVDSVSLAVFSSHVKGAEGAASLQFSVFYQVGSNSFLGYWDCNHFHTNDNSTLYMLILKVF